MRRHARRRHALVCVAVTTATLLAGSLAGVATALPATASGPSASADRPAYQPPVEAPVADGFRPPASAYGAGNRGLDFTTSPGSVVRAAAGGEVVFAGQVGGTLHVVILHGDGIRTSYSFLASVGVHRGDRVEQGDPVGTTGPSFHFGARAGDAYIDPAVLLSTGRPHVHLVADDTTKPLPEPAERAGLVRMLLRMGPGALKATTGAIDWARQQAEAAALTANDELRGWAAYAHTLAAPVAYRVAVALATWQAAQSSCTPTGTPAPRPAGRRRVILVGGLGSASGRAAVLNVDTVALGYRPDDVVQFSYRGGSTADHRYGPADTQVPIEDSGVRLLDLIEREVRLHPGVPIDLIAHSQGGLVVRAALGWSAPAGLGVVITIASPHHGADLATLGAMIDHTGAGRALEAVGHDVQPAGIDPTSPSVREMAESSRFIKDLAPWPNGVRLLSIGERLDPVVPAPRTAVAGATNVVVHAPLGGNPHSAVTASPGAEREMARFLAGQAPTCQSVTDVVLDALAGATVTQVEASAGALATITGHLADGTGP